MDNNFQDHPDYHQRRAEARKAAGRRRLLVFLLIAIVALAMGIFIGYRLREVKEGRLVPPPQQGNPTDPPQSQGTFAPVGTDPESSLTETPRESESSVQSQDQSDTSSGRESNAESPAGSEEGKIQAKANTGDAVQDAQGKGTNHNKAASVYAYPVQAIKEAMFEGKPLAGDNKIAFLTFDDGPSSKSTGELLDILAKEGVPATFFLCGRTMNEETKPLMRRMMDEGHGLAYHSFSHDYAYLYPGRSGNKDHIMEEYDKLHTLLNKLMGEDVQVNVWRYPGGHMSWKNLEAADKALADRSVHWIDWNSTNGDAAHKGGPKTPQAQVEEVLKGWTAYGKPNCITLLMHDTPKKEVTRKSIPLIVEALRKEGFSFGIIE